MWLEGIVPSIRPSIRSALFEDRVVISPRINFFTEEVMITDNDPLRMLDKKVLSLNSNDFVMKIISKANDKNTEQIKGSCAFIMLFNLFLLNLQKIEKTKETMLAIIIEDRL